MGSTIRNICAEWLTASFDAKPKIAGSSTGASRKVHACIVLLMITNQAFATISVLHAAGRTPTFLLHTCMPVHTLGVVGAGDIENRSNAEAHVADLPKGTVVVQVTDRISAIVEV